MNHKAVSEGKDTAFAVYNTKSRMLVIMGDETYYR